MKCVYMVSVRTVDEKKEAYKMQREAKDECSSNMLMQYLLEADEYALYCKDAAEEILVLAEKEAKISGIDISATVEIIRGKYDR